MQTYAIHEDNMPRLMKKMTRIQNKCKKYGCDFHFAEVGEEYRELKTEDGEKYTARFVLVEAEGKAVVNEWKFVASIQNTEKGNIINKATDEVEVPERYYTGAPVCEHCGNKRVRNTFLVLNEETGEFKQVGRSCLCDYTHGMSAEGVIAVQQDLSPMQTLKTLIHEVAHATLHCEDGEQAEADRGTKEVQAESVAYTVCNYFGVDTSDYSFGYVAAWSKGKELEELKASLEVIRTTAGAIIDSIAA